MADGTYHDKAAAGSRRTGWTGWVAFGGIMLVLLGLFHAVEGLVSVFDDGYYLVGSSGLVVNVDYTVWGWVHLALGVLTVIVGIGLLTGNTAARVGGVILAGISAIVNLGFVAAYPVWSILVIALDVIVIYAIVAHGREMTLPED
ncbi:DUF7144 family membrane protein [Amycolatopsis alkalitolerans]|uniref:DUF7144 domain-containing protein n=1 Tax=Amycolatopsis alkalitolerans TaxID=2547244 RepID=A0A5C4M820_9PSEU|nr:hypothetical protein [Amycolatopsis alkalitolerans]TNC29135.1 hypothetical protein FG385_03310 [Amycolatopsis alkalitolerans]